MTAHLHRAPADCPVCGEHLAVSRLGCPGCGTELVGSFAPCPYCALSDADLDLLRVFLASRGNLKEVEKHLGVSYPTARARFNELLERLGLADESRDGDEAPADGVPGPAATEPPRAEPGASGREGQGASAAGRAPNAVRDQVLAQVAAGTLAPDIAADLLARL